MLKMSGFCVVVIRPALESSKTPPPCVRGRGRITVDAREKGLTGAMMHYRRNGLQGRLLGYFSRRERHSICCGYRGYGAVATLVVGLWNFGLSPATEVQKVDHSGQGQRPKAKGPEWPLAVANPCLILLPISNCRLPTEKFVCLNRQTALTKLPSCCTTGETAIALR